MRYAIGDVHGRPFWKHYLEDDFSHFYFAGDYFDTHSRDMSFAKQYDNFAELCAAARADSRLKLCLGNHDYHYLKGVSGERYSGYQYAYSGRIAEILEANIELLNVVYDTGDGVLVSHAGITARFFNAVKAKEPEDINRAFRKNRNILKFNGKNPYGDDITQSPIWVRPGSLQKNPLPGYDQIVGHTPVQAITGISLKGGKHLALIDTGDTESVYRF